MPAFFMGNYGHWAAALILEQPTLRMAKLLCGFAEPGLIRIAAEQAMAPDASGLHAPG